MGEFRFNGYIFSRNDLNKLQVYMNDIMVGFISAFRPNYEDTKHKWAGENSDRQRALGRSLGALGLGYVVLEGHWQEPGGNYEKEHWGDFAGGHDEAEKTFAVLNNSPKKYSPADFIDILRHAAEAYEQDSVMIVAPKSGGVEDHFGNVLLAGHGYYYSVDSGYSVPVDKGTFHADMVGDWVEVNGEIVGRGYSRTPGRKGRTFVFNYFDFAEAREHIFNTFSTAEPFHHSVRECEEDPVGYFGRRLGWSGCLPTQHPVQQTLNKNFRGRMDPMNVKRFSFFAWDGWPHVEVNSGRQALKESQQRRREVGKFASGLRDKEAQIFQGIRAVLSSGAGISRILQHLENTDIAFISAFLTGGDPEAGGYGVYEGGGTDSLGNVHKAGEKVSKNENRRRNKSLARAIEMAGYGFIKVEGTYDGKKEETFCVINAVEDLNQFAEVMHQLGNEFKQDSVLICPKGNTPYFYKFNGSKKYATPSNPNKPVNEPDILNAAVDDYFTQIRGKKFSFPFPSSGLSFSELISDDLYNRSSLYPIRGGMVSPSVNAFRRKLLANNHRQHSKSRRGLRSDLSYADFDQWEGALNIYSSLGIGSLRSWLAFQGYSEDAENSVVRDLKQTLFHTAPGSEPITSTTGPRSLAAWALYEKAQKLKAGGITYKEMVNLLARDADIMPKEVKDIVGTSSEWEQGVFDYGLEPLHKDEADAIQSQKDREFSEETWRIYSAVVAKQDPVKSRFLSGQINIVGAIDELMEAGMDYDEAEDIANSWLPKSLFES